VTGYVFVESRSTADSPDVAATLDLVDGLGRAGHEVTLYLVQNAVLLAGATSPAGAALARGQHVRVWADDWSLDARGLPTSWLALGVRVATMAELVRLLAQPGVVPVWH
jgi:sulfur transfer complex TusBCD TusB component (DsrH family)